MKHPEDYTPIVIPTDLAPHEDATVPVSKARIQIATKAGIDNAEVAAVACRQAGLPYYVACALLEKESHGANVYGHDAGGALSGFPKAPNPGNFEVFDWMVSSGHTSNGVGPCQITYPGYFPEMAKAGLKPYVPADNMVFGFRLLLAAYHAHGQTWKGAGTAYNGAASYGTDLATKVQAWMKRFGL